MEPIGPEETTEEKGRSFGCLAPALLLLIIFAILAAIAIPNFLKFGAKAKDSEAKSNLAAIHTAQISYFGENGVWGTTFTEINWSPEGKTGYHYSLGSDHVKTDPSIPDPGEVCGRGNFPTPSGVNAIVGFTAHASGNIDQDNFIDGWQINDDRQLTHPCNDTAN